MGAVMEKESGATKAAVCGPEEDCVKKAVGATEETVVTVPPAPEKDTQGKCFTKTVGEEATFLETAKDYFTQFKDTPAKTHWICITNRVRAAGEYVSQKSSSVFGKQKVEPVATEPTRAVADKDGSTPDVADKPAAVESH